MAQAKNANYRSAITTLYSLWTNYMKEMLGLLYEKSPHEVAAKAPGEMKFPKSSSWEAILIAGCFINAR